MTLHVNRRHVVAALSVCASAPAWSQLRLEVSGAGATQVAFSMAPFKGGDGQTQLLQTLVQRDLESCGLFRQVPSLPNVGLDETQAPDAALWRAAGTDLLLVGSMQKQSDGRFDVRFRLWDLVRTKDFGGLNLMVGANDVRLAAHYMADFVYEKITGNKGVFATKIAYVTKKNARYDLWVADADGDNYQSILSSPEPVISPCWSPKGNQLAYVSFESRKPVIYVHDLATRKRKVVADFKGSNSAPAWSPDGTRLVVVLSVDGASQLYSIELSTGAKQKISVASAQAIETEPVFSPDGKFIYFVSDRGGAPQIYRTLATGGAVDRVTYSGGYNISPALSPDGRHMAYIARMGGGYQLHLLELASGQVKALTDGSADESPSFAPNGQAILYATRRQGRECLMTVSLDGRYQHQLVGAPGDIREPDWSPFRH